MRLIDAEALIDGLDHGLWGKDWDKALAEAIIRDVPTIDAVPVVRCRDCKYYFLGECTYTSFSHRSDDAWDPHDYCSCGERKEMK